MPSENLTPATEEVSLGAVRTEAQAGLATVSRPGVTKFAFEIQEELAETARNNQHKREQEKATFYILTVVGAIVLGVCLLIIFSKSIPGLDQAFTDSDRQWAQTAITALFTGIVGYVTGSRTK